MYCQRGCIWESAETLGTSRPALGQCYSSSAVFRNPLACSSCSHAMPGRAMQPARHDNTHCNTPQNLGGTAAAVLHMHLYMVQETATTAAAMHMCRCTMPLYCDIAVSLHSLN